MLGEKEVLVVGDFAENFTFVMMRSRHITGTMLKLPSYHPSVCYWLENGVSKHVLCVAVSA